VCHAPPSPLQLLLRRGVRAQLMAEREAMLAQFCAELEGLDARRAGRFDDGGEGTRLWGPCPMDGEGDPLPGTRLVVAPCRRGRPEASRSAAAARKAKGAAPPAQYAPINARARNESPAAADMSWALAVRSAWRRWRPRRGAARPRRPPRVRGRLQGPDVSPGRFQVRRWMMGGASPRRRRCACGGRGQRVSYHAVAVAPLQAETLREWVEVTSRAAGRLSLEMTGRLMEFDTEGNMTVRYSEAMVVLLRLRARRRSHSSSVPTHARSTPPAPQRRAPAHGVGLAIPDRIRAAAAEAEKYYRFGVQLQKVRLSPQCTEAAGKRPHLPRSLCPARAGRDVLQRDGRRDHTRAEAHAARAAPGPSRRSCRCACGSVRVPEEGPSRRSCRCACVPACVCACVPEEGASEKVVQVRLLRSVRVPEEGAFEKVVQVRAPVGLCVCACVTVCA